jgi:nucleotide-binding universal stress UspA family protein
MISIDRILVPIDFSDPSRAALTHAAQFARWYGARVTVLHALSPVFVPAGVGATSDVMRLAVSPEQVREEVRVEAKTAIAAAGLDPDDVDFLLETGDTVGCIVRTAAAVTNTLVVIGTHGHGGFDRLVLGSVTEKVLRKAPCPVLTIPPASRTPSRPPLKRLVCALDFSAPSLAALDYALSIAREADAHLTLVHVLDWPPGDTDALADIAPGAVHFRRSLEEEAQNRLDLLKRDAGADYCDIACVVAYGRPHERILDIASAERADLVVIGVHGRNALGMALFGSTTNQVIRHAACPVLTLRQ